MDQLQSSCATLIFARQNLISQLGTSKKRMIALFVTIHGLCTCEPSLSEDVDMMVDLGFLEGHIHMAGIKWDDALVGISETLYRCSKRYGPNSIKDAKIYFAMEILF